MNYGNHLGNDALLSIVHEARVQFLAIKGYNELDIGGCGLIMADAMIVYKGESYYGDTLKVEIFVDELTRFSFDLLYKVTTIRAVDQVVEIAHVKTGMVCYDYAQKKVVALPGTFVALLEPA